MSSTGLTLPGVPSLLYLAFLFGHLPWAAARGARRMHGGNTGEAREGGALPSRTSGDLVPWTCTDLAASVAEEVAYRGVAMRILGYALYDFIAGFAIRRAAMARAVTAGLAVALLAGGIVTAGDAAPARPPMPADLPTTAAPDSFRVVFETTKGPVVALAHRAWSPLAVDRLHHLVNAGFYDGTVIFRVGPTASYEGGFVVQFGITNDGAVNAAWDTTGVPDEPVIEGHRRGRLYFARGGPNTRSTQLAIDLTANTPLDTVSYQGVVGFPAIGEIVAGMAALDSLERRHGNTIFEQWDSVATQGRAFLDRKYPGLDRIERARVEDVKR